MGGVRRKVGCRACRNTGYQGRTAISELLVMNEAVRQSVLQRATESAVEAVARRGRHGDHVRRRAGQGACRRDHAGRGAAGHEDELMPRFSYRAYDDTGARATGVIDSETREAAIESLFRQGRYPLELVEGGRLPTPRWWEREVFGPRRMSRRSLALLTRELATLVKAELPIDEALRIARLQPLLPARSQQVIARVLDRVVEGASLSEALGQEATTFPAYYARVVQAGEAAGTLGQIAGRARRLPGAGKRVPLPHRLGAALPRPVADRGRGGSPRHHDGPDPDGRAAVQGRGRAAAVHHSGSCSTCRRRSPRTGCSLLVAAGAIAGGYVALARNRPLATVARPPAAARCPCCRGLIQNSQTAIMTRTLGTLIRNGVPLLQALQISGDVLSNRAMAAACEPAPTR